MSDAANSGSSEEASKDGASSSEQSSGGANEKGREERRAADRANHAADAKRSRYFTKLMVTVAKAHECDVSLAVTAFSNSRPNSNIREAVVGLAGTQRSKVMPHLAKIRRVMAATVKACVRDLAQQASEPALQPQKQRKGHKKGPLRTRLGRGEGPSAEQPPAAENEACDAELLRGSQAAGTAEWTVETAGDAARPLQQGQPHPPA